MHDTILVRERLHEEKETSEAREKEADEKLRALNREIAEAASTLIGLKEDAAKTRDLLAEQKDQLSASSHRLKSLEDLAAHHAYTSEAVRMLLEQAQENAVSRFHTAGILADLLEVESHYEAIVETFLKQELEYVLVDSDERVNHGIQLLKDKSAGRTTFLVYGNDSTAHIDHRLDEDVKAALLIDETLIPLKSVVRIPNEFENAICEGLFHIAHTFIASSYAQSVRLARRFPSLIFLSPDGEIMRGRLITGGGRPTGGHFSLKREPEFAGLDRFKRNQVDHSQGKCSGTGKGSLCRRSSPQTDPR
jgi:chromosome segregation protein